VRATLVHFSQGSLFGLLIFVHLLVEITMKSLFNLICKPAISLLLSLVLILSNIAEASAFCGFYVGGADAKIFNESSQVIIAHQDDKTILTMANDFQGAVKDFALVVPVPVAIKREQVNIGDKEVIKKLDAFSQPRLVEYTDENPCDTRESAIIQDNVRSSIITGRRNSATQNAAKRDLGVTIEDRFNVKEYEILILNAKESDGLETWLRINGYQIPKGASEVLAPYIRQKMKFFVAKINLKEFKSTGLDALRPLQIAYQSPKFMLPIRLGMLNAKGAQDLVAYILSPKGQVEVANYRTVKVPTGTEIPEFVKEDFGKFYKSTFQRSYEQENKKVAFLEYAWDVSNCDPCSTTPPTPEELRKAGVFWENNNNDVIISPRRGGRRFIPSSNTFITRLHVRYARAQFAEDLVFQETSNRDNFQGRYVMNHPYRGTLTCAAAQGYVKKVADRQQQEAQNLAKLTGWNVADIKKRIQPLVATASTNTNNQPFWPWK
jgi:hypothetical protein